VRLNCLARTSDTENSVTPASSRMMPALVEVTSGLANSGLTACSGVEDCTARLSTMIGRPAVRVRDLASHAPAIRTATAAAAETELGGAVGRRIGRGSPCAERQDVDQGPPAPGLEVGQHRVGAAHIADQVRGDDLLMGRHGRGLEGPNGANAGVVDPDIDPA